MSQAYVVAFAKFVRSVYRYFTMKGLMTCSEKWRNADARPFTNNYIFPKHFRGRIFANTRANMRNRSQCAKRAVSWLCEIPPAASPSLSPFVFVPHSHARYKFDLLASLPLTWISLKFHFPCPYPVTFYHNQFNFPLDFDRR